MTKQQTHKSDEDAIKDILLAPVRARMQTSDIRTGILSSTGLNEKVSDLTRLLQQARRQERERVLEWIEKHYVYAREEYNLGSLSCGIIEYDNMHNQLLDELRTFLTNPNTTV